MVFLIQHNDGRVHETDVIAEAKFYAWLSIDYSLYNVYSVGGPTLGGLIPQDFYFF